MCGKAAVSHLSWARIYAFATSLTPPSVLPADPESRINVSPSRLRRKSEPDSMVWETLPIIYHDKGYDRPAQAIWPYIPYYSEGRLPMNKQGRIISTANARLRLNGAPFAPTFMGAWSAGFRVIVAVSWFYEFDSRVRPQVPYAVFPTDARQSASLGGRRKIRRPARRVCDDLSPPPRPRHALRVVPPRVMPIGRRWHRTAPAGRSGPAPPRWGAGR